MNWGIRNLLLAISAVTWPAFAQDNTSTERQMHYIEEVQVTPLYAWPGVDLDAMAVAIDALNKSRAELVEISQNKYDPHQMQRVKKVLYPTDFLSELRLLEAKRRWLNTSSELNDLQDYQDQLLKTIAAHKEYLERLIPALRETASEKSYAGLEFHSGRSSFTHFLAGMEAYQTQAHAALVVAKDRWGCLQGDRDTCSAIETFRFDAQPLDGFDPAVFEEAPAQITRKVREKDPMQGELVDVPWAVLTDAACFPPGQTTPYLMWRFPAASGGHAFRAEVVSDLLVHDHRLHQGANAYEQLLDTLGAEGFLLQTQTTLYACPDAALDTSRLRALVHAYDVTMALEAFPRTEEVSDEIRSYVDAANFAFSRLKQAPYLSEPEMEAFLNAVAKILSIASREELKQMFVEQDLETLRNELLAYKLKTPGLDQSIMNLVFSNAAIGDYSDYAPWDFLDELLFTRNAPQLMLGGTNPSIVPDPVSMVETVREGPSPRLLSYSDDLSKTIPSKDMIEILLKGALAENRLSRLRLRPYLYGPEASDQQ